jgi:hypothetical protein
MHAPPRHRLRSAHRLHDGDPLPSALPFTFRRCAQANDADAGLAETMRTHQPGTIGLDAPVSGKAPRLRRDTVKGVIEF